jgi:hypothetical protein
LKQRKNIRQKRVVFDVFLFLSQVKKKKQQEKHVIKEKSCFLNANKIKTQLIQKYTLCLEKKLRLHSKIEIFKMSKIRQNFHAEVEAGINRQVNMELRASYVYQSMVCECELCLLLIYFYT